MTTPTAEQALADYQAKLRAFHQRHGTAPHSGVGRNWPSTVTSLRGAAFTNTTPRSEATVSALRGVVFTGTAGK